MNELRKAAARERLVPHLWWLGMGLLMGTALVIMTHRHSPLGAVLLAVLLAAGWAAPMVALRSLAAPRRATACAPAPGEGRFRDWLKQARLLGRVLMYHEDNPELPRDLRRTLHAAREDLRDTFRAHPLRDDLERVCERVRSGAIRDLKRLLWRDFRSRLRDLRAAYERAVAGGMDEDERLAVLQESVENAAALATRYCMPRMLERERLSCVHLCAWLAVQGAGGAHASLSPIELAGALVIEWCDFSEPWQPALVLRRAAERVERHAPPPSNGPEPSAMTAAENGAGIPGAEAGAGGEPGAKRVRVRVRVRSRRGHRRHSHRYRGPTLGDILLSFGQWLRYSVRSWMLYR